MSFDKHVAACIDESSQVGAGCRIGPYAVIEARAVVGENSTVEAHVVISTGVRTGSGARLQVGCQIGPGAQIGHNVSIGALASLASSQDQPIGIGDGATIESHATVRAGVVIGHSAIVEAGAVVTRNVPALAVVSGNPAKIVRYVTTVRPPQILRELTASSSTQTTVRGVTVHQLPLIEDLRGTLSFGEEARHVPFPIRRYFLTFDVDSEEVRGEHAHRSLEQFLICIHGRCHLMTDDGRHREEFILDRPNIALYLPPMIWGVQYRFSPGAVLLVFCSDYYDPDDYIRDYQEFTTLVGNDG